MIILTYLEHSFAYFIIRIGIIYYLAKSIFNQKLKEEINLHMNVILYYINYVVYVLIKNILNIGLPL